MLLLQNSAVKRISSVFILFFLLNLNFVISNRIAKLAPVLTRQNSRFLVHGYKEFFSVFKSELIILFFFSVQFFSCLMHFDFRNYFSCFHVYN